MSAIVEKVRQFQRRFVYTVSGSGAFCAALQFLPCFAMVGGGGHPCSPQSSVWFISQASVLHLQEKQACCGLNLVRGVVIVKPSDIRSTEFSVRCLPNCKCRHCLGGCFHHVFLLHAIFTVWKSFPYIYNTFLSDLTFTLTPPPPLIFLYHFSLPISCTRLFFRDRVSLCSWLRLTI